CEPAPAARISTPCSTALTASPGRRGPRSRGIRARSSPPWSAAPRCGSSPRAGARCGGWSREPSSDRVRPPRLVPPVHVVGPTHAGKKPRRKVLELAGVSPSEVAREERPVRARARALDGHAIVALEIAKLVGLARLRRNALSAQRQRQLPREIIARITFGAVND